MKALKRYDLELSGSRNNSEWNMNDDDYERFFSRI